MAISQCGVCKLRFGGVSGFDAHRRLGHCLDPHSLGMVLRDGIWRKPMTQAARERLRDIDDARWIADQLDEGGES